jgi:hypothetical protein
MSLIERLRAHGIRLTAGNFEPLGQDNTEAAAAMEKAEEVLLELMAESICACHSSYTDRKRHEPNTICYLHADIQAALRLIRGEP